MRHVVAFHFFFVNFIDENIFFFQLFSFRRVHFPNIIFIWETPKLVHDYEDININNNR